MCSVRIRIEPKVDYWGRPLKRHVPDKLIRLALVRRAAAADGFLARALAAAAGVPVDRIVVRSAIFDHFQEGDFQMVFQVRVFLPSMRLSRRLCVLASKGSARAAGIAAAECRLLRCWARRASDLVVSPLAEEWIRLPPASVGAVRKRLFVYATPWQTNLHELGVDRDMRFFVNQHPIERFPAQWTDLIKTRILALCLALYDSLNGRAIAPPLIGAGDIMISRPAAGKPPRVKLIAARGTQPAADLKACLSIYLNYVGLWGGRRFRLAPRDPAMLRAAVHEGLVQRNGMDAAAVERALRAVLRKTG